MTDSDFPMGLVAGVLTFLIFALYALNDPLRFLGILGGILGLAVGALIVAGIVYMFLDVMFGIEKPLREQAGRLAGYRYVCRPLFEGSSFDRCEWEKEAK